MNLSISNDQDNRGGTASNDISSPTVFNRTVGDFFILSFPPLQYKINRKMILTSQQIAGHLAAYKEYINKGDNDHDRNIKRRIKKRIR